VLSRIYNFHNQNLPFSDLSRCCCVPVSMIMAVFDDDFDLVAILISYLSNICGLVIDAPHAFQNIISPNKYL
jgi:hypothetical protein